MTPRPEDVALLRRLADMRDEQAKFYLNDRDEYAADAEALRALASRLEGEGRDAALQSAAPASCNQPTTTTPTQET